MTCGTPTHRKRIFCDTAEQQGEINLRTEHQIWIFIKFNNKLLKKSGARRKEGEHAQDGRSTSLRLPEHKKITLKIIINRLCKDFLLPISRSRSVKKGHAGDFLLIMSCLSFQDLKLFVFASNINRDMAWFSALGKSAYFYSDSASYITAWKMS